MATSIMMPFCRLLPATTLVVAGFFMSGAASSATAITPANVTYCSGCLCDDSPPRMSVPGDWLPSGGMLGGRVVLKFVPRDQGARLASSCPPPPRA